MNSFSRSTKRPMRKVSSKRETENAAYWPLRTGFLIDHKMCQFKGCLNHAQEIHHTKGRYGKNFLNVKSWRALCRDHRIFLHENPNKARELGLLK